MTGSALLRVTRDIWRHPGNRGRRGRALATFAAWQVYKRTTGRSWDTRFNGMTLRVYPDNGSASSVLYFGEVPDYAEMHFMHHYLRPGDRFIDVGANIGLYTLLAASLTGPAGRIHAFEPGPDARRKLQEHVTLNRLGNVTVHDSAVSDAAGVVRFIVGNDSMNRMEASDDVGRSTIEVRTVRLDEALTPDDRYAMGKMDVEGAEPLALRGAERMLAGRNPPVWLLEINGLLRNFGHTEEQLDAWLSDHGYKLMLYDPETRSLSAPPAPWRQNPNVLAIAIDAERDVRARLAMGRPSDG